jgi:hypothetical protein
VASLHKASRDWERAYGVEECVQRWNRDLALTVERLGSPRHHAVLYEALTTDTEPVLRSLFTALGLSWEPDILNQFPATARRLVATGERWKEGLSGEIRPSATAATVLDASQRERVQATLRHGLYDAVASHAVGHSKHG